MKQHTFTLSKTGSEFPERFGGQDVTYDYPETYEELLATQIPALPEGTTREQIVYHAAMHQGLHLTKQKAAKAYLGREIEKKNVHEGVDIATAVAGACKAANEAQLVIPGAPRGEGKSGKVAKAEARAQTAEKQASVAKTLLLTQYAAMPKNLRKNLRQQILDSGVLTAADLDAIDNAA